LLSIIASLLIRPKNPKPPHVQEPVKADLSRDEA